jgi:hypothetical protein
MTAESDNDHGLSQLCPNPGQPGNLTLNVTSAPVPEVE